MSVTVMAETVEHWTVALQMISKVKSAYETNR
jgi:hypothetical protein